MERVSTYRGMEFAQLHLIGIYRAHNRFADYARVSLNYRSAKKAKVGKREGTLIYRQQYAGPSPYPLDQFLLESFTY